MTLQPSPTVGFGDLMDMVTDFGIESLRVGSYEARKALVGCDDWKLSMLRDKRQEARERIAKALYAALASQAQPEQPKQDSFHLSGVSGEAATARYTDAQIRARVESLDAEREALMAEYCRRWPAGQIDADDIAWATSEPGPVDTDRARSDEKEESVAALPEQQWQPIETAPKDGRSVLLTAIGLVSVGGWLTDMDQGAEYEGQIGMAGWWVLDSLDGADPTHWQALPPPPVDQGAHHG